MHLQLHKFDRAVEVQKEGHVQAKYSTCDRNKKKRTRERDKKEEKEVIDGGINKSQKS